MMTGIDTEIEIIHGLGLEVLQYEVVLSSVSDLCGELDWYEPRRLWLDAGELNPIVS